MVKEKIEMGEGAAENTVALNPIVGMAREDLIGAVGVMLRETAGAPIRTLKHMKNFSGEVVKILRNNSELAPDPKDKRFADPAWRTNPLYRASMQYYLAVKKGVRELIDDAEFDDLERARASFVTGMILDAVAPTNSLIGNPSAHQESDRHRGRLVAQRPQARLRGHHPERRHCQPGRQAPVQDR